MTAGIRAVEIMARDQAATDSRNLPRTHGQLRLANGQILMTSFRRHPEHGYVEVRAFNPRGGSGAGDAALRDRV